MLWGGLWRFRFRFAVSVLLPGVVFRARPRFLSVITGSHAASMAPSTSLVTRDLRPLTRQGLPVRDGLYRGRGGEWIGPTAQRVRFVRRQAAALVKGKGKGKTSAPGGLFTSLCKDGGT